MQWGAGDPFQELVARLSQEHAWQVERLQRQVERLQRQVDRLTAAAPQGGAGPESAWHRFAFALSNLEETRRNLPLAIEQQRRLRFEAGEGAMAAALEVLSVPHAAVHVAVAYDAVYARADGRTALWKASAAGIRTHIVMRYCCEAEPGSRSWVAVEQGLILALGEHRFSAASTNLRAQFIHAYQQIYPVDRSGRRRQRPARQRTADAPTTPQRSTQPEPAAEESPEPERAAEEFPETSSGPEDLARPSEPEPAAEESPGASSGQEDPAAETAMQLEISTESRAWKQPQTWVHNTFLDVDETDGGQSDEGQSSQCKESVKSYPRRPTMAVEKRKRHRLLRKLAEEDMLPEETSKLAKKVVSWDSPTIDTVELLIRAGHQSHIASNPETMASILEALRQVAERLWLKDVQVAALHDVIDMLLAAMERHQDHVEVQKASLDILLNIARSQCQVLGVCCAREPAEQQARIFSEPMRARILRSAGSAAEAYWQCRETAVKVVARTQLWQEVEAFVSESHAWKLDEAADGSILMDELYYHLQEPLEKLYDQDEYPWATALLGQLAEQQRIAAVHPARMAWVRKINWMSGMKTRFILNGILSGVVDGIAQPLQWAVEAEVASMDVDLMTAGLRAIIDLNDRVKKVTAEIRDKLNAIAVQLIAAAIEPSAAQKDRRNFTRSLRSAIAGVLGSLNRGRGEAAGRELGLLVKLAQRKLVRWFEEASFHHEVLWAVVEVFEVGHLGEWGAEIFSLAESLFRNWSPTTLEQDPENAGANYKDEGETLELAKKILEWRDGASTLTA